MPSERIYSSPETVKAIERDYVERLCRGFTDRGTPRRGIVVKVFAARNYDGVRCLVYWDSLIGGNPTTGYHDVTDVDVC